MKPQTAPVRAPERRLVAKPDPAYPSILREISDPPAAIFIKGEIREAPRVAVVGSRDCTRYGRRVAFRLGVDLARAGLTVVSGLARGIDSAAHRGALEGGGRTIAVLPCGIDSVYPRQNRALAAKIVASGALVTEFEPGTTVHARNFRARNRIIAGLAYVTVVVEAAERSGARMTATLASDYSRDVLAVPGRIDSPTSAGANKLLSEFAGPCTGIRSVFARLPAPHDDEAEQRFEEARNGTVAPAESLDATARRLLEAFPAAGSCSLDRLSAKTKLDTPTLLSVLTKLEVLGLIRTVGSQRYERVC